MWKYFFDRVYFGLWAVRNTNDKRFGSTIHVRTEEEAEFLVKSLNELDELKKVLKNN